MFVVKQITTYLIVFFSTVFHSGLIRATSNQSDRSSINSVCSINARLEFNNQPINETVEEEKLQRDNSVTEKLSNRSMVVPVYSYLSKSPSVSNSITVSEHLGKKIIF